MSNNAVRARKPGNPADGEEMINQLAHHVLVDGFRIVVDLEKSNGRHLVDSQSGREFVDFYGAHGSMILGFNHPRFEKPEVQQELRLVVRTKIANSDMCSAPYAKFVTVFDRVLGLRPLERFFFIEGGALAVENAIKAAMDWKVRRNMAAGRGPRGTEILHFERAFHGRSGYTLSLTNTDPRKTDNFAKFCWPRVPAPWVNFALPEPERTRDVMARERFAEDSIGAILRARAADIAAIIIEPIQGEGGDNHFRREWLAKLRELCDQHDVLLIFDEVQTGAGTTGAKWCCEHFGIRPDLLAFGKKVQVCGVMAGPRLDDVPENCFRLSGRINSTWGGNLVDMVRSTHSLLAVEEEKLVENASRTGGVFLQGLSELAKIEPMISAPRGRGLMLAFDLADTSERDLFYDGLFELGLLSLRGGERSIRFRPSLDVSAAEIAEALELIREQCRRTRGVGSTPHRSAKRTPNLQPASK